MDYKKLYEKAVERAKTLTNSGFNDFDFVKHIFPELKESEDERIRKELIFYLRYQHSISENFEDIGKWIAWLEKQGEKLPVGFYYVNSEGKKFYSDTFKYGNVILHVEKQGEQKSNPCDGCINRKGCINCENGELREVEQKSADKVEPKFKVSDWINGYYTNYKVLSANNEGYVVEDIDGNKINILFENEKFHHLWTIQDAKDGDVLVCENGWTCIFNCLNNNLFSSHCFMDDEGWFCEDGGQVHTLDNRICGKIHPATKEQYDQFEKAMVNAGYKWNKKERKLEKIEQKHTSKHKIGDTVYYDSFGRLVSFVIANIVEDGTDNPMYEDKEGNAIFEKDLIEQKPAWSEEDSPYYDDICEMLINLLHSETADVNKGAVQKDLDWLMSLRPQNKWKPSDEQMITLRHVISGCSYDIEPLVELETKLKEL